MLWLPPPSCPTTVLLVALLNWKTWATTMESQMGSSLNIFSTHLYATTAAQETSDLESIESTVTSFNQPVWLTETGWTDTTNATAAGYYTQLLDTWLTGNPNNDWVSKIFFYGIEEDDGGAYDLLNEDNTPTLSYTAIQQFVNAPLTWDNAGGAGDGVTWDVGVNQNWNNGSVPTIGVAGAAVTFNDTNNGQYAVTLNSTVSPSSVTVDNSAGNYVISGTGKIADAGAFTKSGADTLTLGVGLTASSLSITGGTLKLATNTTLGSGTVTSNVTIGALLITGAGVLDLTNNHIIINYGSSDPISTIVGYIKSGYNGGAWNGAGIDSSAIGSNTHYGVGYADSADQGNPVGLAPGTLEVKYTLNGDANLDGVVNGTDFGILAANFGQQVAAWDKGDFNYDGVVNGSDFGALAGQLRPGGQGGAVALPRQRLAASGCFRRCQRVAGGRSGAGLDWDNRSCGNCSARAQPEDGPSWRLVLQLRIIRSAAIICGPGPLRLDTSTIATGLEASRWPEGQPIPRVRQQLRWIGASNLPVTPLLCHNRHKRPLHLPTQSRK